MAHISIWAHCLCITSARPFSHLVQGPDQNARSLLGSLTQLLRALPILPHSTHIGYWLPPQPRP